MTPLRARPLLLGLSLALAPSLAHADSWKLGDKKQRYDLKQTAVPEKPSPYRPKLSAFQLIDQALFPDGRRPKFSISDPGELVWHYALEVPKLSKKPRGRRPLIVEVDDAFKLRGGGELKAHGNHSVRAKGKRWVIRSSLVITCTKKNHWLQKANLVVSRRFHTKRGLLENASYRYEIKASWTDANKKKQSNTSTYEGRITNSRRAAIRPVAAKFHVAVQEAITRGKKWLVRSTNKRLNSYQAAQKYGGQALGKMALPCFALLRSGLELKALKSHFKWMERQPLKEVYSVSLWIMVLEARSIRREARAPRSHTRTVARFQRGKARKRDLKQMQKAVRWLLGVRKAGKGWWSYYGNPRLTDTIGKGKDTFGPIGHSGKEPAKAGDRSNSQFAVLALHSALASGIKIPGKVWLEIFQESAKSQQKGGPAVSLKGTQYGVGGPLSYDARDEVASPNDTYVRGKKKPGTIEREQAKARGWTYRMDAKCNPGAAYGSMSAAGTSTMAIAREGLERTRQLTGKRNGRALASLRDGLAWLLHHYDVARNPLRGDQWYYYYAYSLEKAYDLAGVERIGQREWWRDVAAELLARQKDDGSWGGSVESTSFALLVLNRATLPVKLEISAAERAATGVVDGSLWDRVVVEGVGQLRVRQLLNAMAATPHEASKRLELARKALATLSPRHRPRVIPELVALLRHKHKPTRRWARESCRLYGGSDKRPILAEFCKQWEVVRLAGEGIKHHEIPRLREIFRSERSTVPLKKHALGTLSSMQAVEALGDVIEELNHKDVAYRRHVWTTLVVMAGKKFKPFEPDAGDSTRAEQVESWRDWWDKRKSKLIQTERIRRAVANLAIKARAKQAAKELRRIGRPALRALVDGLRREASRERAHGLLQELSGMSYPPKPEPWLRYLDRSKKRR